MSRTKRSALAVLGTLVVFGLWFLASNVFRIDPTLLPPPGAVLGVLKRGVIDGTMYTDITYTLWGAMAGLLVGSLAGFMAGVAAGEFESVNRFVYPIVLGAQSMPTIAIAPLLTVWLGIDIGSKITLVAISCYFPVFIGTVSGLNSGYPELRDLYRVYSGSRWRTLWELKLPGALNYVFAGLQVAVVLSFIVCVVGEFVSSVHGLGHLIKALSDQLDVSAMFGAIVLLASLGAIAAGLMRALHRRVVFWEARTLVEAR